MHRYCVPRFHNMIHCMNYFPSITERPITRSFYHFISFIHSLAIILIFIICQFSSLVLFHAISAERYPSSSFVLLARTVHLRNEIDFIQLRCNYGKIKQLWKFHSISYLFSNSLPDIAIPLLLLKAVINVYYNRSVSVLI